MQQTRNAGYVARVSHVTQIQRAALFMPTPVTDEELPFTEAKILLKDSGDHVAEYVAECLNGQCKYLGQLPVAFQDKESLMRWEKIVSLEQKYGIPEKTHAPKGRLFHRKVRCTF